MKFITFLNVVKAYFKLVEIYFLPKHVIFKFRHLSDYSSFFTLKLLPCCIEYFPHVLRHWISRLRMYAFTLIKMKRHGHRSRKYKIWGWSQMCVETDIHSFPYLCISEITIWKVSRLDQKAKYGSTFWTWHALKVEHT